MKKILSVIFLFVTVFSANAQKKDTSIVDVYQGAFIYIYAGPIFNNSADLNKSLNEAKVFGAGIYKVNNSNVGANVGFGGMMLFDRGILIGANAGYSYLNSSGNAFAKTFLSSANVMVDFGKVIYNRNGFVIYPFLGVGLNKYFLNIKDVSDTVVRYNALKPLYKGQSQTYISNSALFEVGVSFKKTLSQKYVLGLDLGGYFSSTTQGSWKDKGVFVQFREAPNVNGAYARITFQLAKFKHRITDLDTVFYSSLAPVDTSLKKTRFGRLVEESAADKAARDSAFVRRERERAEKVKNARSENTPGTVKEEPAQSGKDAKNKNAGAVAPADTTTKDVVKVKKMKVAGEQKPSIEQSKDNSKAKKKGSTKVQKSGNPNDLYFNFSPEVKPTPKEIVPAKTDTVAPVKKPETMIQADTTKTKPVVAPADTVSKKPVTPPQMGGEQNKKPKTTTKKK